jgi:catechol 2,3-dioxygenase-like lactoylglutathione lyase family enzyme
MPADIYPMPSFPTLTVSNLAASSQWYRDALNFQIIFELPGRLIHLRRERYQDLLLTPGSAEFFEVAKGEVGRGVSLYFALGGLAEVDALAAHAKAAGATVLEGPLNRPWNNREVVFSDPDGYRLVFGAGPVDDLSFDEVMKSVKQPPNK